MLCCLVGRTFFSLHSLNPIHIIRAAMTEYVHELRGLGDSALCLVLNLVYLQPFLLIVLNTAVVVRHPFLHSLPEQTCLAYSYCCTLTADAWIGRDERVYSYDCCRVDAETINRTKAAAVSHMYYVTLSNDVEF